MKTLFLSLLLLSPLAHAEEPAYRIPPGATTNRESCEVRETVRVKEAGGWSEARLGTTREEHRISFWNDGGDHFYSLLRADDGTRVVFTEFQETYLERNYSERAKKVITWEKAGGTWAKKEENFHVAITKSYANPQRVEESSEGKTFVWEVRSLPEGNDQLTERKLTNLEAFSTEDRKVESFTETCRFQIGN